MKRGRNLARESFLLTYPSLADKKICVVVHSWYVFLDPKKLIHLAYGRAHNEQNKDYREIVLLDIKYKIKKQSYPTNNQKYL